MLAVAISVILFLGVKTGLLEYKLGHRGHLVGECFVIPKQLTTFQITGLRGPNYVISGIVLFFPFKRLMSPRELNRMLYNKNAKQIDCKTGKPLGEKNEKSSKSDSYFKSK